MIRHSPGIAVATLCCLLAITMPARAQAAWVLWEKTKHSRDPAEGWTIKGAHEARNACETALDGDVHYMVKSWLKSGATFLGPGESAPVGLSVRAGKDWLTAIKVEAKRANSWSVNFAYTCLPDTVDPRGPKGK